MAMFGLGANYDGTDVTQDFLNNSVACVGWPYDDAPSLHHIMRSFQVGDIVYIKSHPPNIGLIVKAVGLVRDSRVFESDHGKACVRMEWIWHGNETLGHVDDRYNVKNNTLYEEWNPDVRNRILNLLLSATREGVPPQADR
jgi:hypothetical protein